MTTIDPAALKLLPIFMGCTDAEIHALTESAEIVEVRHRECLVKMGSPATAFAVVLSGAFKLLKLTPEGSEAIVYFATPGEVIAGLVMSTPSNYPVSAVAMGVCTALKIPRQTFVDAWGVNMRIQHSLRDMLFSRMSLMHEQRTLQKATLSKKVASELITLIERYSGQGETVLPIPITRQEIADSVGASVESVIRVISDWSQHGYLTTEGRMIRVLKMDKMIELMLGQIDK